MSCFHSLSAADVIRMRTYVSVCISAFLFAGARAQITSENADRHFIAGARAASLADSYVAEAYDVTSMYTNPATLPALLRSSVVVNYSLERILGTDNIMNENAAVPIPLRAGLSLGVGATFSHVGHVRESSPLSGFKYSQYGLDVGVGWFVTRFISVGSEVTARYGKAGTQGLTSVCGTVGAYYSPSPEIAYGVSLQGLGDGLEYSLDSQRSETTVSRENLDRSVQIGVSWRFRDNREEPILTLVMANQKILRKSGLVYKGGIEFAPVSFLALRAGYWVGQETLAPKFGGSVRVAPLQLDYAVSPSKLEPVFHQFSLSLDINNK